METANQISRKDFLKNLGLGSAALWAVYCTGTLTSCKNETTVAPDISQFSINLEDAANANLKTNGGYVIKNDVVIAKTMTGTYVAVTVVCSHQQLKQVTFTKNNEFYCTAHEARYDTMGKGLNQNGSNGLKTYPIMLMDAGKTLIIG